MTPIELLCFALHDLTACRWAALGVSTTIFTTIAFVCAITVAAYGLAFGSQHVAMWRIEQDPLALCLWVGDSVFTKRQISREVVERVQTELSAAGYAESLRGCFPFRVCEGYDVQRLDGLGFGQARGRTVLVEAVTGRSDPVLDSLAIRAGRTFQAPDDEGVVITPEMLLAMGLSRDAASPSAVTFMIRGQPRQIRILGVTKHDMPDGLLYLLPERFEQDLRAGILDPPVQVVYSGIMSSGWPKYEDAAFPAGVRAMIESPEWQMEAATQGEGPSRRLALRSRHDTEDRWPRLSDWRRFLERINREMVKATGHKANASFAEPDALGAVPELTTVGASSSEPYDLLGVYCRRVEQLRPVAKACEAIPLFRGHVNKRIIEQLEVVDRETKAALRIVLLYESVVVGMAVLNLLVIQVLRAWQKIAEAGMLKAIGMTWWQLIQLVVTETGLLWAAAAAVGIPAGLLAGRMVASWKYELAEEVTRGFHFTCWHVFLVSAGSFAVCVLSSLLATITWHVGSPARLLRSE